MLGNIINTVLIILGGGLGVLLGGRVSERFETHMLQAMALVVVVIGAQGAIAPANPLMLLFSLALGAFVGEWLNIEKALTSFSEGVKVKLKIKSDGFVTAFVTATLLYCVGAMAIMGSLESGLQGNHAILMTKGGIDGVISVLLASTMGIGVAFSALPVFLYQGSIVVAAQWIAPFVTDQLVADVSVVGSVMILAIGLNMLKATKIKVGNLLPALVFAVVFSLLLS